MKILITNHHFKDRGGSELFALEIGMAFKARGHAVCIFSPLGGELADVAEAAGLSFVRDPADCPFVPDVIHGQHHLETMAALTRWQGVPGIYYLHGATPWEEHPPKHPRLRKYLGTSPRFNWWIARECGVPAEEVGTVRNFFDPLRFSNVRAAGLRTHRAAVFHNTMDPKGKPFAAIQQACATFGLQLHGIGTLFGNTTAQPEVDLLNYDVIFAGGRSAIEAMACGCTVIPVTKEQAERRIHPEIYDEMADRNFTAEINAPHITSAQILTELQAMDSAESAAVTARIRSEATLDRAVEYLLHHYQEAIQTPANPEDESACMSAYLLSLAQRIKEVDEKRFSLIEQKQAAAIRAEKWQQLATRETKKLQSIQNTLESGTWWHRRLWRKLRRGWD